MSTTNSITSSGLASLLASGQLPSMGNTTGSTSTSQASNLIAPGLASGMNWESIIQELAQAERAPETQWQQQQTTLNSQTSALSTIKTDLTTLQTDVQALQDPTLYQNTAAQSSNAGVATASSVAGATTGSFTFNITQLATAAQLNGKGSISQDLVPDGNPADVTIGTAGFATPVTAGTFTVNGAQVSISTSDTLQDVFNHIASATNNAVTATYNSSTDEIELTSHSGPLVLGSAADTSNFLEVAQLYDANASSVTSTAALGLNGADPGSVSISSGFSTPVNAGTFTVDGAQVTVAATDTLQAVFNKIATATNNNVTASYNTTSDEITLASSNGSPLVLGSASDTSNFLQVAQLFNTNATSVTSSSALGRVNTTVTMSDSELGTAINNGGSSQGAFTINGVTFNFNASADSIQDVLNQINSSSAGVTAAYDTVDNRFVLTNNSTGNVGISVHDITGNFLGATGLLNGSLVSGQNLTYTLNHGTQTLQSESNTIAQASSGIQGLSVTALSKGNVTVAVSSDTSGITSAIQQFVTDYNSLQNYISSQQAVTTSASGTVTPGSLTGNETVNDIVSNLRSLSFTAGSGLSGSAISTVGDLGIQSDGQNNTLTLSDTSTLNRALANNLSAVQSFFTDKTSGVATQLNNYITDVTGSDGELTDEQATLSADSTNITTQISNLETKISSDTAQWTSEFQAMEQAESQANQELTYLSEQVTNGTL